MLKEDDLPPHLRRSVPPPQPMLELEMPLETPIEPPVDTPAAEDPADPYLRTS